MSTITENPIILDITTSYGYLLCGSLISCALYGISCLQVFLYFVNYENDKRFTKLLVIFLWVIDTANELVVLAALWPVLIKHYGGIAGLSEFRPEMVHHAWIAGILECCVQLYFTKRIHDFTKGKGRKLFAICMIIISAFQLVVLIPYDIITVNKAALELALSKRKSVALVMTLRAVSASQDALLAGTLIYLVLKNGLPKFENSKRMAVRLLIVTVNSGLWTAVVALIELSLVAAFPDGLHFCIMEMPLCSLYFSSLLANLNARQYVKGTNSSSLWNSMPPNLRGTNPSDQSGTLILGPLPISGSEDAAGTGLNVKVSKETSTSTSFV